MHQGVAHLDFGFLLGVEVVDFGAQFLAPGIELLKGFFKLGDLGGEFCFVGGKGLEGIGGVGRGIGTFEGVDEEDFIAQLGADAVDFADDAERIVFGGVDFGQAGDGKCIVGLADELFGGGSGGGVPRMFSSTQTPRLTGEVLKF